jgi:predicted DNA-binding protein (MmcQ/YjbR family)
MFIDDYRTYCLSKPGVTESTPFGPDTLVFKVMNKMFAITGIDEFVFINLKSTPEKSLELRESHEGIKPGWHMNKTHWNSVFTDGSVSDQMIRELTDESYDLIVKSLPKKLQKELEELKALS